MLLIVDDNKQVRRMIRSLVEDLNGEIVECADGSEAVAFCTDTQPELVLMDLQMKSMDGLTATRKIKTISPDVKIVIVTDHADAKTRAAAFEAGADEFFGKENLIGLRKIVGAEEKVH